MLFSKNSNELVTTHGFSAGQAQNQGESAIFSLKHRRTALISFHSFRAVVIWRYPTMQQVAQLTGHSYRVSSALSFDISLRLIANRSLNLISGSLPCRIARWTDYRHWSRRRDFTLLERFPAKQG